MLEPLAPFCIYIDADACPKLVKEVVFKAAIRQRVTVWLVANRVLATPKIRWIHAVVVESGPDQADAYIIEKVQQNDLAVTADIPLAAQVLAKGAIAIDHRGREFTQANIHDLLAMRDLSTDLREAQIQTSGPKALGLKDKEAFANALNRCMTRLLNRSSAKNKQAT